MEHSVSSLAKIIGFLRGCEGELGNLKVSQMTFGKSQEMTGKIVENSWINQPNFERIWNIVKSHCSEKNKSP